MFERRSKCKQKDLTARGGAVGKHGRELVKNHGLILTNVRRLGGGPNWHSFGWTESAKEGEFGILKCARCGSQPSQCRCTSDDKTKARELAVRFNRAQQSKLKVQPEIQQPQKPPRRLDAITGF